MVQASKARDRAEFAGRLEQAMAEAGLTRNDLVQLTGAHANRVRDWLRGARWPSVPHLVAITKALGADLGWLLTGERQSARSSRAAKSLDARSRQALKLARELADLRPRLVDLAERADEVFHGSHETASPESKDVT